MHKRRRTSVRRIAVRMTPRLSWARVHCMEAMRKWGLTQQGRTFRFNKRKKSTGLCCFALDGRPGRIELSQYLCEHNSGEEVIDTIRHEIAHALAGRKTGHGPI